MPTLTSALTVIWMFFIAYAMFKYKLFVVNFEYVSSYIIDNIDEIIIISDSSGNIMASNNVFDKL